MDTTLQELNNDKQFIIENNGHLSPAQMMHYYEKYMSGADSYLLGVEFDEMVYGIHRDVIDLKYCSCQFDSKAQNQYLRFRPHEDGAQDIATQEDAICFGCIEEVYHLYACNAKQGYNAGYCFEIAAYNYYGLDGWKQDNKPSYCGGDMVLNDEEIQLKYAAKGSLATITTTKKILSQINKFIAIAEKNI